ncbi:MAG: diacylglycerol kinase family protein [Campylobacterota bacterium]|nr:diacylglycerol kinase family protein [Campylobacterota bacterium]
MKILSVGKVLHYEGLDITSIESSALSKFHDIDLYNYIIIHGGDGTIRRVLNLIKDFETIPTFILNPTGSFNVIAKIHRVPKITKVLKALAHQEKVQTEKHHFFSLNNELFLFSAGNMGDLQHVFLSETFRFGLLEHGPLKYLLSVLFLLPVHLIMTPFMLMSSKRFFIFTPARFIKKFGSFYGEVNEMSIDLENEYNLLELDGDLVTVHGKNVEIKRSGYISIVLAP